MVRKNLIKPKPTKPIKYMSNVTFGRFRQPQTHDKAQDMCTAVVDARIGLILAHDTNRNRVT